MSARINRRIAVWTAGVLALGAFGDRRALPADEPDISSLVGDLVSGDPERHAKAIEGITAVGLPAALLLLRPGLRSADKSAEGAVLDALEALGIEECLGTLYANQTAWPVNRRGVEALLGKLRERRDPKLTKLVTLKASTLDEPRRIPPYAEWPLLDAIPAALAGAAYPVQAGEEGLGVDTDGDGEIDSRVDPGKPRRILVGPERERRPLFVQQRLGRWYASSASLLKGTFASEAVELLDTDLDGAFDGALDLIAVDGEGFRRHATTDLIFTASGAARYRVVPSKGGFALAVTPEPEAPGVDATVERTVAALNGWRRQIGLPPVFVDLPRSRDCAAHVEYWRLNGYSAHDEFPSDEGYSKAGARAGRNASVSSDPRPDRTVLTLGDTIVHRPTNLGHQRHGLGVAYGGGSCIWGGSMNAKSRGPILVPAPGQTSVPLRCAPEIPSPDRDPGFYDTPRGYPVSASYAHLYKNVRNARIELFRMDDWTEPLSGDLFSAEQPYKGEDGSRTMTWFVADRPLDLATWYCARFTATGEAGDIDFSWTFRTN